MDSLKTLTEKENKLIRERHLGVSDIKKQLKTQLFYGGLTTIIAALVMLIYYLTVFPFFAFPVSYVILFLPAAVSLLTWIQPLTKWAELKKYREETNTIFDNLRSEMDELNSEMKTEFLN